VADGADRRKSALSFSIISTTYAANW